MSKIVISSDYTNLEIFLKNEKEQYLYILIDYSSIAIEDFLKEKNYKKVDINEGLNGLDFRKEYIDFIGRLNSHHNSLYWWANSISYKGTFVSDLCREIFSYYCVISLMEKHRRNYIIVSNNLVLNNYIKRYCEENKIECRLLDGERKSKCIVHLRRCCLSSLYFLCDGWLRKILISLALSQTIKKSIKKDKSYYIIKSWVEKRSFSDGGRYTDLFFGKLPQYLKERQKEFIIVGGILRDYKELIWKTKGVVKDFLIIPQEYFVGYLDYLKVIILTSINRSKIVKPTTFCGLEVTDFLRECLKKDYENNEINKNFIYYYFMKGLSNKVKVNTFVFTFENQAWERMSLFALRKYSPSTRIIGYAHSSIRQSLLGYFYSKEEEDIIPLPDRIVTTGKEPKLILEMTGNYINKLELSEGCALRYEYIFKKDRLKQNKNGKILAAFTTDVNHSIKLLKFLYDTLGGKDGYKVVLRSHPFMPLEMIITKYNMKLGSNFQISKNTRLEQDLKDSCLLVYVDTTSSIEALMRGVPAIHIDFKEPANPDALFKLNSLKWTVSDKNELYKTIDYIYNMDTEEYLKKYEDAISYLKRYFYPVKDRYLERFVA